MLPVLKDTAGLGTFFWLLGYLASLALYFSPVPYSIGWVLLVIFTPFTIGVTWWWFNQRERLPLQYYAGVGIAWTLIAIVLDYLFIVLLFNAAEYYMPDVLLYYVLMFFIPVGVGLYLHRKTAGMEERSG
jgi:hypothetical protein